MKGSHLLAVAVAATTVGAMAAPAGADAAAPSRYIVVLERDAQQSPAAAARAARARGAGVSHVYRHALGGYAATLPPALLARLRESKDVAAVVPDGTVKFFATQTSPPSYGIDRVDQRALPLSKSYTYEATGATVDAYVIDTGINRAHQDFGGRAVSGIDYYNGGEVEDCQGHGTHVAGTVGGTTFGVAKGVRLIGVRIGNCTTSISISTAIDGIDWVTGHHQAGTPAVANLSFGGGSNSALDTAVKGMIADGVTAAIAAGNGNLLGLAQDACTTSPARVPEAITVGATTSTDAKASYSNYGSCLDIFAPGSSIVSASHSSTTGSTTLSGTSMAAPHVAGAAAMYLQTNPSATPAQVASALTQNATAGVVGSPGSGSPNKLLYTAFIGSGGEPPANQAPSASFTSACTDLTCAFSDTSTDADGTIAARAWDFGDGTTSTAASPSKTYAAGGTYSVRLTVTDNAGATATTTQSITVTAPTTDDPDPATPTLTSGVTTSSTSAARRGWKYFKIAVPSGRSSLSVTIDGPSCWLLSCAADLDLFVRRASKPTLSAHDCSAESGSSDESCSVTKPAAEYYYIGVYTYSGSSGHSFTVRATY